MDADGKILGFSPMIVLVFVILVVLVGYYMLTGESSGHPYVEKVTVEGEELSQPSSLYIGDDNAASLTQL